MLTKLISLFQSKPYRIKRERHAVFVLWHKTIDQMSTKESEGYLASLQQQVKASVDTKTWNLIGIDNPSENPDYLVHVQNVRTKLVNEFGLQACVDEIEIGTYHMGMLVLSFPTNNPEVFPYYYHGIQLKPHKRQSG